MTHGRGLTYSGQNSRESDSRDTETLSWLTVRNHPQVLLQSNVHHHAHRGRGVYEGLVFFCFIFQTNRLSPCWRSF